MTTFKSVFAIIGMTGSLALSSVTPQSQAVSVEEPVVVQLTMAETLQPLSLPERRVLVREKINQLTKEAGIEHKAEEVYTTIAKCENISLEPTLQSGHRYKSDNPKWGTKAGDQELSFGLVMIHLPSHPDVTKEQAQDPDFALRWMVDEFAQGHEWQWTCWRSFYQI